MDELLAVCCWRLAEPKVKCNAAHESRQPTARAPSVSCDLSSLVSLGIFAHGASHFSPICTTDHISTG